MQHFLLFSFRFLSMLLFKMHQNQRATGHLTSQHSGHGNDQEKHATEHQECTEICEKKHRQINDGDCEKDASGDCDHI